MTGAEADAAAAETVGAEYPGYGEFNAPGEATRVLLGHRLEALGSNHCFNDFMTFPLKKTAVPLNMFLIS